MSKTFNSVVFCTLLCTFIIALVNASSSQTAWNGNSLWFNVDSGLTFYPPNDPPTQDYASTTLSLSPYNNAGWTVDFIASISGGNDISSYRPLFYIGSDSSDCIFISSNNAGDPGFSGTATLVIRSGGTDLVSQTIPSTFSTLTGVHVSFGYRPAPASSHFTVSFRTYPANGPAFVTNVTRTFTVTIPSAIVQNHPTIQLFGWDRANGNSLFGDSPAGYLDEFRVWDRYLSPLELAAIRGTILVGNEPGLLVYYNFDTVVGTTMIDLSPNGRNGTFNGGAFTDVHVAFTAKGRVTPIIGTTADIAYDGSFTAAGASTIGNANIIYAVNQDPYGGRVCEGTATNLASCTSQRSTTANPAISGTSSISYVTDRRACNTNTTILLTTRLTSDASTVVDDVMAINLRIGGISPVLAVQNYTVPAQGGQILISGSNLGLALPLDTNSGEGVTFQLGSSNIPCTSATASASGITCNIAPGVGKDGRLTVSVCNGQTITTRPYLSYAAPLVSAAVVASSSANSSQSVVTITGLNFGPARASLPFDSANYIRINGTDCIVTFLNDTYITCETDTNLSNNLTYFMTLSIGGQETLYGFNYVLCPRQCRNGGTCIGFNLCDCSSTGYEGDQCQFELICQPPCVNGTCVRSRNDTSRLLCQCKAGFIGDDCSQTPVEPVPPVAIISQSQDLTLVIGLGAGGGSLALILLIGLLVGWFMFFKQKKRGTKNFIPLEKKDFTKIIYGEQLNQDVEKHNGDLALLETLLLKDDLKLATAVANITQITEADKIAKALVIVFHDSNKALTLLQAFIDEEVKTTESAGTLFRSNSMVSKMFKFYSRLLGLPYLYTTIGPEIDELITAQLGLEVDPEKMTEGTDLDEMRWMLMAQSQKILKQVLNSWDSCPTQFRSLFSHLKYVVAQRFPDNVNTTIGGFIFLRFFCPAVSSPEAYGILEEPPSPESRRLLILITKVLQNLSNDVEFGSKEPYMAKMNDFIQSNRAKLVAFYANLVKPTNKPNTECVLPKNMKNIQLAVLSNHIRQNIEQIEDAALKKQLDAIV